MRGGRTVTGGVLALSVSILAFTVTACSKGKQEQPAAESTQASAANETAAAAPATGAASAPAAAAAPPPPDNTDTLSGAKLASFTGDATKGEAVFLTCKTCHSADPGVNKIGPSLHGIIGRKAGQIPGFVYSAANKNSGITWTPEKLFQYLENPQRIVPGTKMTFVGFPNDPQKRADVIAYLKTQS